MWITYIDEDSLKQPSHKSAEIDTTSFSLTTIKSEDLGHLPITAHRKKSNIRAFALKCLVEWNFDTNYRRLSRKSSVWFIVSLTMTLGEAFAVDTLVQSTSRLLDAASGYEAPAYHPVSLLRNKTWK